LPWTGCATWPRPAPPWAPSASTWCCWTWACRWAVRAGAAEPNADGLSLLGELRQRSDTTPVIVLTARDGPGDRVRGLDTGADDYLVKPFEFDELTARIRAVLRRHGGRAQPVLRHGAIVLDPATRQVQVDGEPVLLSAREFAVLEALMQRPGALLAGPAGGPALRLGRGDREQRRLGLCAPAAPQAGGRAHRHRARRGLLLTPVDAA
jgi:hypothetical protein